MNPTETKESNSLHDFSVRVSIETSCSDYVIDMTAFCLDSTEIKKASELYSKTYEKFLIIVVSRSSEIIAYCLDKIETNSTKKKIYEVVNAHDFRILCIKGFKPSISEQSNLNLTMPFCIITGGLGKEIKIWDALCGALLKTIKTGDSDHMFNSDLLIFQFGKTKLYTYETLENSNIPDEILANVLLTVGPPKAMKLINIEFSDVDDIKTYGSFSLNAIEEIGQFTQSDLKKNYILFATADKGSSLRVWKITRKNKSVQCYCIKRVEMLMFWILSLSSFRNSSDPYKSKLIY